MLRCPLHKGYSTFPSMLKEQAAVSWRCLEVGAVSSTAVDLPSPSLSRRETPSWGGREGRGVLEVLVNSAHSLSSVCLSGSLLQGSLISADQKQSWSWCWLNRVKSRCLGNHPHPASEVTQGFQGKAGGRERVKVEVGVWHVCVCVCVVASEEKNNS